MVCGFVLCCVMSEFSQLPSDNKTEEFKPDSIVQSVLNQFVERAKFGKQKYGTDLDRTDLEILDWIQHAQEEHMDAILYLEKLKKEIQSKPKEN